MRAELPDPAPDPDPHRGDDRDRPARRWGLWTAGALSAVLLTTSGAGWALVDGVGSAIGRVNAFGGLTNRPMAATSAENFLIVGTDDREGVPAATLRALHAGGESCHCTDTMMLVHLSAKGDSASVVSIPRDSYVAIPGHGMGKINAAYGLGGAQLTVATVEQATGLRIDHYLELNFLSFISTVDALGGVPVCTDRPLRDPKSGLDLPAGTTKLDGAEALRYVRARYVDPTADLGRMQRQQKFVAQVIAQATSGGTLLNPLKLERVMSSVLGSVKVDQGLGPKDLVALATRLKGLRPSSASFATVPLANLNYQVPKWGSTVLWDQTRAAALFRELREDQPLTPPPAPAGSARPSTGAGGAQEAGAPAGAGSAADAVAPGAIDRVAAAAVRVQVLNGAGVPGLGGRTDTALRALGFATSGLARNEPGADQDARTVIRYQPGAEAAARLLARAVPQARLVAVPGLGATLRLVVGRDYAVTHPVSGVGGTPAVGGAGAAGGAGAEPSPSATAAVQATRGDTVLCT